MDEISPVEVIKENLDRLRDTADQLRAALKVAEGRLAEALALFAPPKKERKVRAVKPVAESSKPARKPRVVSQAVKQPDGSVKFPEATNEA